MSSDVRLNFRQGLCIFGHRHRLIYGSSFFLELELPEVSGEIPGVPVQRLIILGELTFFILTIKQEVPLTICHGRAISICSAVVTSVRFRRF